jgi:glyoxalase family protein
VAGHLIRMKPLKGIHHVTAITGDAQQNVDFYSGALGLRLVKKTVNFDDPGSYHLYYGDRFGTPGTLVTFFVWPGATRGRTGAGEPVVLAFEVPEGSLEWWKQRFTGAGIRVSQGVNAFGENVLSIADPDGMRLELVARNKARETEYWAAGGVSKDNAITAIHSVALALRDQATSGRLYTGELTFQDDEAKGDVRRFRVGEGASAAFVDAVPPSVPSQGRMGAGTIHHMAFRTDDDSSQREWLEHLTQIGLNLSPVMDRKYFHSIYFRELGGVLFEIATDGPGMAVDENREQLGEALQLPNEYESLRTSLERSLPPITAPRLSSVESVRA